MAEMTDAGPQIRIDDLYPVELIRLDGTRTTLGEYRGRLALIVNVASRCGYTPQYAGLQELYRKYADRGFVVLGFPCNQFGEQEPGTAEEIGTFCSVNYDVTFPLFAKIDVNGPSRHSLYGRLTEAADYKGRTGDIVWNFEKFLVSADGVVLARFSHKVPPEHAALAESIQENLP